MSASYDQPTSTLANVFWRERGREGKVSEKFVWKFEEWEMPQGLAGEGSLPRVRWTHIHEIVEEATDVRRHHQLRQIYERGTTLDGKPYWALPDEEIGFWWDPTKVQYSSSTRMIIDGKPRECGQVERDELWENLNLVQFVCPACKVQQKRGMFYGDDALLAMPETLPPFMRELDLARQRASGKPNGTFQPRCNFAVSPKGGPYIARDEKGRWERAAPVNVTQYNRFLMDAIVEEMKHRQMNEEYQRTRLNPMHPHHYISHRNGVDYYHPIIGHWRSKGSNFLGGAQTFRTIIPTLRYDYAPTDQTKPLRGWLELARDREIMRKVYGEKKEASYAGSRHLPPQARRRASAY